MAIKFFHCSTEYVYIAGSKNTHVSNKFHLTANQWKEISIRNVYILYMYIKKM